MYNYVGDGPNGVIKYVSLTDDRVEEAIAVQQCSMYQECIALGVDMYGETGAAKEMQIVFREVIKDGCSVVAIDVNTDRVIAVAFNKLHMALTNGRKDPLEIFVENNIKYKACLGLINFLGNIESSVDLFKKYDVSSTMEIFYVGTDPRYRGCSIGQRVVEASLALARCIRNKKCGKTPIGKELTNRHTIPEVAFGVFTSEYSQRIAAKLNFEWLTTVYYEQYYYEGKKFSDRIGDIHKTARLGAIRL
ncbi:uncharacterized protein LOC107270638 isoform X2 [Cephus cinctus]|nr:uncharacterized protein LOC107270638 isoform X2 [Cephus cinctus]XP_015601307.1 uncharacterized protein LOC107270638 isoform X2 [Cephus cinctus]XP_015601308.1 uncharacterized protein LOC107270638 isoform X2 [Cephus cinctus]